MIRANNNKIILALGVVLVVIILFFIAVKLFSSDKQIVINNKVFKIELAQDASQQARGLSGRLNLAENRGMLFVMANKSRPSFWMKDMFFPLDIIWISNDKVVDITNNAPIVTDDYYITYAPKEPVDYVLEINAGLAEKYGIKIGDTVKF